MLNGFINLYKPIGITSNKAIGILKYNLKQNNIVTKIGHFGTLDPIAEGVLPIALGRATRLFSYSLEKKKQYTASFLFGVETDTLDADGTVMREEAVDISKEEVMAAVEKLIGTYDQMPPIYSAKSVGGVKAYKLARRGEEVELSPKAVTIYQFDCLEKIGKNAFSFRIACSAGTYIRAIARDLGAALGTVGIMTALRRDISGIFTLETAVKLTDVEKAPTDYILPMETALGAYPKIKIPKSLGKQVYNGVPTETPFLPDCDVTVWDDETLLGIGYKDEEGMLRIRTWLI